jgi:hypothetical protein
MHKDLIKTYQFNKSIDDKLNDLYEGEEISPGRRVIQFLQKETRKECRMTHHNTHRRHYESHAEEQKRLAKNVGFFYAYTCWDEDRHYFKCYRGHSKCKKEFRKYAARKVRREYNRVRSQLPTKNLLPQNGGGYKKFFDLWWTID